MAAVSWKSSGVTAVLAVVVALLLAGCCEDKTVVREVEVEVPGPCGDGDIGEFVGLFPPLGTLNYQDVWGSSENNIFAVGDYGTIAHFGGTEWELMDSGTMYTMYAVWGSGPNDVYVVGESGIVIHYDGTSWERLTIEVSDYLSCIWGSAADDVYIGASAYVYHYDGEEWTRGDYLGSYDTKYDMWGSSPTNIFAVGYNGAAFHYDGSGWTDIRDQIPTTRTLRGIWGTDSTNIYVVGDYGTLLHHDGSTWTEIIDPVISTNTLYDIHGRAADDIYVAAANARVFHYTGSAWEEVANWDDLDGYQYGIWVGSENAYSVGEEGEIAAYDGAEWTHCDGGPYQTLKSVWAGSSTEAVAVGYGGTIYRYDGDAFVNEGVGDLAQYSYYSISGEAGNLFIAGGAGVLLRDTGSGWEFVSDAGVTTDNLYGVWSSGGQAIAVGEGGRIVHYDGSLLSLMTSGTSDYLSAVWGSSAADVFAVGNNGTIIHYDGNLSKIWEEMDSGVDVEIEDVWGTAHNNVYACGGYGFLLHYDGSTWEQVWIDAYEWFNTIDGTGEDDIYVAGYDDIYHYDGTSWSHVPQRATYQTLNGIGCADDGSVFAVGYSSAILYKQP
jgi:hypothetical protein